MLKLIFVFDFDISQKAESQNHGQLLFMYIDSRYAIRHTLPSWRELRACRTYIKQGRGLSLLAQGGDNAPFIRSITHAPDQAGLRLRPFHCGVNLAALAIEDYCLALSDFHLFSRAVAQNGRSQTLPYVLPISRFDKRDTFIGAVSLLRGISVTQFSRPSSNRHVSLYYRLTRLPVQFS